MPAKPESARKVFAANLRQRRLQLGLSQEEFASRCGLHRTYIGSVERGERNVSIDNMERIAAALGVNIASLLGNLRTKS
jgi:transcriptional regulator with XRE-family HTH domain